MHVAPKYWARSSSRSRRQCPATGRVRRVCSSAACAWCADDWAAKRPRRCPNWGCRLPCSAACCCRSCSDARTTTFAAHTDALPTCSSQFLTHDSCFLFRNAGHSKFRPNVGFRVSCANLEILCLHFKYCGVKVACSGFSA